MKVLVTGAGGFLGSHLVDHLMEHTAHQVVATSRGLRYRVCELVPLYSCDLSNLDAAVDLVREVQPDAIVHCAGLASTPKSIEFPVECFNSNLRSTFNLVEASRILQVKRFVNVSSNVVYGANTMYKTCKLASESIVDTYDFGCNLRLANLFGEDGDHGLVAAILKADKVMKIAGDGNASRYWLHVDDACQAIEHALRSTEKFTIDVCSCVPYRVHELLQTARVTGVCGPSQPGDAAELPQRCTDAHHLLGWSARKDVVEWLRSR